MLLLVFSGFAVSKNLDTTRWKSGYQDTPYFGCPNSVGETQKEDDRDEGYRFSGLQTAMSLYFDWKETLNKNYGLALSFDYNLLYQIANKSAGDKDAAEGGIFRFFGSWTAQNPDEDVLWVFGLRARLTL